jgi:hypothetical protein
MSRALMGLLAISCLSVFACSQTAKELVNKNIEAKGGIDRIRSAKTLLATGKVKSGRGRVAVLRQIARIWFVKTSPSGYDCGPRTTALSANRSSPFADVKNPS